MLLKFSVIHGETYRCFEERGIFQIFLNIWESIEDYYRDNGINENLEETFDVLSKLLAVLSAQTTDDFNLQERLLTVITEHLENRAYFTRQSIITSCLVCFANQLRPLIHDRTFRKRVSYAKLCEIIGLFIQKAPKSNAFNSLVKYTDTNFPSVWLTKVLFEKCAENNESSLLVHLISSRDFTPEISFTRPSTKLLCKLSYSDQADALRMVFKNTHLFAYFLTHLNSDQYVYLMLANLIEKDVYIRIKGGLEVEINDLIAPTKRVLYRLMDSIKGAFYQQKNRSVDEMILNETDVTLPQALYSLSKMIEKNTFLGKHFCGECKKDKLMVDMLLFIVKKEPVCVVQFNLLYFLVLFDDEYRNMFMADDHLIRVLKKYELSNTYANSAYNILRFKWFRIE